MIRALFNQRVYKYSTLNRVLAFPSRSITQEAMEDIVEDEIDMPNLDINPFAKEKPKCFLCYHNIEPNYKNVRFLAQFQSQYTGDIFPAAITGLCKHKHDRVSEEIQKARQAGLMAYKTKDPRYVYDPKLFNENHRVKKIVL